MKYMYLITEPQNIWSKKKGSQLVREIDNSIIFRDTIPHFQ